MLAEFLKSKRKYILSDITDNRINVFELNKGQILNESILTIYSGIIGNKNQTQQDPLKDYEFLRRLFKLFLKKSGAKIIAPCLYLCIPHELTEKEYMEKLSACAGPDWGNIFYVSNFLSAYGSLKLDSEDEYLKNIFIYSNTLSTYTGCLCGGEPIYVNKIDKGSGEIQTEDVLKSIEEILRMDFGSFKGFNRQLIPEGELIKIEEGLKKDFNRKVYLCIPEGSKANIKGLENKFELKCSQNYESCIMEGLKKAVDLYSAIKK